MIGIVDFSTPRGEPFEAILDDDGRWRCPRLPVLDRVLNALYAPDRGTRDRLGPAYGRAELQRVAAWLRGSVRRIATAAAGRVMPAGDLGIPAAFATERLWAERLDAAHFDAICRLHRDPLVMRTLSADGRPLPDEVTRQGIEAAVTHWRNHGFGLWAFHERASGRFVGRGGLKMYGIDEGDRVGLAYAVVADCWGLGFATEMAAASLDVGFGPLGFDEVATWTLPTNRASQRVMEKLGFRYERDFQFAGLPHRFYRLSALAWHGRCPGPDAPVTYSRVEVGPAARGGR